MNLSIPFFLRGAAVALACLVAISACTVVVDEPGPIPGPGPDPSGVRPVWRRTVWLRGCKHVDYKSPVVS